MEVRVEFKVVGKPYILFIEKGLLRIKAIYLFEKKENDWLMEEMPTEISTSTLREDIECWLQKLRHRIEERRKKNGEAGCCRIRNSSRGDIE